MTEDTRSKEELFAEIEKLKKRLVDVQALQVQRRLIEENLREKEELMSAIVKAFDGYIYTCASDYTVTFMNKNLMERTGRDATGEKCYEVLHNRQSVCPWCVNEKVFKGDTVRWEVLSPKDNRWFYIVNTPIFAGEKVISKMSMFIDITERKKFEERLRESEEKFKKLFELTPFAVFLETIDGDIIDCNEEASKMLGYSKKELNNMNIKDLVSARTAKMLPGLIEANISFKGFSVEAENRKKNGYEFPVRVDARILEINNEKMVFVLVQDITESKKAEELLIREKKLHTGGPVVVFRWFAGQGWPVEYVSSNIKQFGYTAEEFLRGKIKYADIIHPADIERVEKEVKRYSKKGIDKFEQEYRIFTADKTEKFLYDSTVIVRNRKGEITHYEGYVLDITERKKAEKEKEKLIEDLQYALAQVKTLRGLMPICSHCKKVRDDKGYWHQVEEYLEKHSEIAFSHGICPDCRKKLYPELTKKKPAKNRRTGK
ncbi:PAS domain S-box protein [bacterium]|jgi:PAS domain-containing protein|nr:PAS domain S-box protein [bacterium]